MPMIERPVVRLVGDEALDIAVDNAGEILERVGVQVIEDAETLELLADAGADVRLDDETHASGRVRWTMAQLLDVVAAAPASFVQHGRSPDRSTQLGGGAPTVFAPVYGPPNVIGDDAVRHIGTMADYRDLIEICHGSAGIANTGHMLCVPSDIPEPERYLEMARAHLELSDKPFMGSTASEQSTRDVIELVTDTDDTTLCRLLHLCNSIPPLTWRGRMLGVIRASARLGQGNAIASFQMLGAMGPVAVLGALSQGIVESLLGIAISQLYREGTPVLFGIYGVPFDMRTMAPRFGDPISQFVQSGSVQLARRFGLPALGYGGVTSSKVDDAQAGSESWWATRTAFDVGADFVLHSAGWLENGRTVGVSKLRREAAALDHLALARSGHDN